MQHETLRGAPFRGNALSASVLSPSMQACMPVQARRGVHPRPATLDVTLCALGRAPAFSLLGVGADRPKWCPAESEMFRHADKCEVVLFQSDEGGGYPGLESGLMAEPGQAKTLRPFGGG